MLQEHARLPGVCQYVVYRSGCYLKTCPICRTERGCNETMVLHGLTEFLECIRKVYTENDDPVRPAQENETD